MYTCEVCDSKLNLNGPTLKKFTAIVNHNPEIACSPGEKSEMHMRRWHSRKRVYTCEVCDSKLNLNGPTLKKFTAIVNHNPETAGLPGEKEREKCT